MLKKALTAVSAGIFSFILISSASAEQKYIVTFQNATSKTTVMKRIWVQCMHDAGPESIDVSNTPKPFVIQDSNFMVCADGSKAVRWRDQNNNNIIEFKHWKYNKKWLTAVTGAVNATCDGKECTDPHGLEGVQDDAEIKITVE
ncbi:MULTISPECIES: hypothetical protein [Brucella/Ochrobactrum group]|uniref:Uncharacterized protein n=1 Tax=Brucella pseudintermedia TaxID=370111 RepID=A0ABY5UFI7_9HYPH|nr:MULTISPECIES: hypothetical protein [Brucella/Ochrobactrum group]KAB2685299.1 hypothetical protein F9K78_00875 [Brucella pseudintermedia]MCO7725619.1 hypothetical protein [Brucella intermedia]NKE76839.1 hypothetical protein [Ochrobactrum sp. MC-1LL]UWL61107.1 hypothetical protein NIK97_04960 [Brucella pseudintermedia]WPM79304.1 hypothetical protein R5W60_08840 [Brucella pseudintermedia]